MFLADDVEVDVGPNVALPTDLECFSVLSSPLRSDESLQVAVQRLAALSLRRIVAECLRGERRACVGSGSFPDGPKVLQPMSVSAYRCVRMFMHRNESERVSSEKPGWMKSVSVEEFNTYLAKLKAYEDTTDVGKRFYGAKLKGIKEQYQKYVPPKFVPDDVELNLAGMTSGIPIVRQSLVTDHFNARVTPATSASESAAPSVMR